MLKDSGVEITGFDSCSETERLVSDGYCQTIGLETSNQGTQTTGVSSIGTQVSSEASNILFDSQAYDASKLLKFLNRIMPHLEEELKGSEDGLNFDEAFDGIEEAQEKSVEMSPKQTTIQPDFCKEKIVSDLTWNATGALLAVASSEKSHEGCCCHESSVGVYNTGKFKFEKNPPMQLLKVSACVRCISFHSHIPSLLAGGLHNGEVVIWDLTREEVLMSNKKGAGDESTHVDAITCLTWREDRSGVWLVTTGRDGKIIFWKITATNLTYEPHQRFLILKQHSTTAAAAPGELLEVLHVSFWSQRESDFVIAAGGGSVFHCSLTTAKHLLSVPGYQDPVRTSYKPHKGIVTCVSCASGSDVFASCGTDSEIHVYKSEAATPLFVIHTKYAVLGVKWTNGSKCLVSWGCSSSVECRKMGEFNATTVCEVEGGVSAVAVNTKRQGRIAVGNQTGEILILSEDAF